MSKAWGGGSTRRWREQVRAPVLDAAEGLCQLRIPGQWRTRYGWRRCLGVADQVHHVDGKRAGDSVARAVAACGPCNRRVGDPTRTTTTTIHPVSRPEPAPRTPW